MRQYYAMNGDRLEPPIEIEGYSVLRASWNGLVGVDVDLGLVTVIKSADAKPVQMKYGKFLTALGQPPEIVKERATSLAILKIAITVPVQFTTTSEEAIRVYENGPQSCMKGCDAVGVYATDDVAVAYLEVAGEVKARAVVCKNPEIGLQYCSTYGFGGPLIIALEKLGYVSGDIDGCELKRIEDGNSDILVPFLDNTSGVDVYPNHLIASDSGEYDAQQTNGSLRTCDCCGDIVKRDEDYYSEYLNESMCESCYDEVHVTVEDVSYHIESSEIQQLEDDEYVLEEDAAWVDYRDEWHLRSLCVYNSCTDEYILKEDIE